LASARFQSTGNTASLEYHLRQLRNIIVASVVGPRGETFGCPRESQSAQRWPYRGEGIFTTLET
jgi:hypothetical protein